MAFVPKEISDGFCAIGDFILCALQAAASRAAATGLEAGVKRNL